MARWFDDDGFLGRRLAADDEQALEFLFRQHYTALKRVSYRIVRNNEQARDIVQDVFAKLWEKRQFLRETKPLKAYLFRSVINRSLNYLRDNPRLQVVSLDELTPEQHATQSNETSAKLEDQELHALINRTILELPLQCRVAFQLSREEEMSNAQIAEYMGVSVKAVEKHITKALKRLRKMLEPYLSYLMLFNW
ncbi:RNA polymerase sigma-70 factor [Cesiribacter sp. SM1]|uniref:RNA polymerase sigma-70 factor n=1 Tax=Cesiribacter sp. SM1 TaxID=2861196 RepID=UPI001CD2290E|nr:RNA polymerase sigma-70 factor [Cesiribacter sp. SM1]